MTTVGENWKCPYCGHAQVISEDRSYFSYDKFNLKGWKHGAPILQIEAIAGANELCKELTFDATLSTYKNQRGTSEPEIFGPHKPWLLLPPSSAKPLPSYIPEGLRTDYEEACAIRDLSPKASATIIRRCLQGMIRDFCKIQKPRLVDEIKELRKQVDEGHAPLGVQSDNVDAIDHVRKIGNIGAHMEADINVIVDVDPDEAQVLIELTELLFDEWYVAAEARKQRLIKLGVIADEKKALQQSGKAP